MPIQNPNNPNPSTIFHKEIMFSTINEDNNEPVIEGYVISGPSNQIKTVLSPLKFVIPIGPPGTTGEGSPFLKFHIPDPNDSTKNKIYLTFCIKAGAMNDGYYDYTTGIPDSYRAALLAWIRYPSTNQTVSGVKNLNFAVYGSITNKPTQAENFQVALAFNNLTVVNTGSGTGASGNSGDVSNS